MASFNSFSTVSLLYLFAIRVFTVCLSPERPEDVKFPSNSSWNASAKNETQPSAAGGDSHEDFSSVTFYLRDVRTTLLGTVSKPVDLPPNANNLVDLDQLTNESRSDNLSCLNYETLWHNGSLTLTLVDIEKGQPTYHDIWDNISQFVLEDDVKDNQLNHSDDDVLDMFNSSKSEHHRRTRAVFGSDERIEVSEESSLKHLPYSAVVSINTGCTGTLIAQDHVLTAAHCIHDGINYITDVPHLMVGVLRRPGKVRSIRVDYMKVPRGWTLSRDYRYDYAVLKLHRRAPPPAQYLEMYEIPEHLSIPLRIQFASFPSDKPKHTLWYSYCKAHCLNHAILNRCDSNYGSSGAGIYGKTRGERFVMGVFSGLGNYVQFRGKKRRMNVGTKITPLKLAQIRSWLDDSSLGKNDPFMNGIPHPNQPSLKRG